jgi:hypothetical protein
MKKTDTLKIIMEFTRTGYLKSVFLGGSNDEEQETLSKALDRIFSPPSWIKRLFRRW